MKIISLILFTFLLLNCQYYEQYSHSSLPNSNPPSLSSPKSEPPLLTQNKQPKAPSVFNPIKHVENASWKVDLKFSDFEYSIETKDIQKQNRNYKISELKKIEQVVDMGQGSGFFISPNLFVTNFHVIDSATDDMEIILSKKMPSGEIVYKEVKLINVSATYDLAILQSNESVNHYLKIRTTPIDFKTEKRFYLIGYPGDQFVTLPLYHQANYINETIFNFTHNYDKKLEGSSGSSIVDLNGEVIGVNYAAHLKHSTSSAISTDSLRNFINGDGRNCELISIEECIDSEWFYLKYAASKGNKLANDKIKIFRQDYDLFKRKQEILKYFIDQHHNYNRLTKQLYNSIKDLEKAEQNLNQSLNDYENANSDKNYYKYKQNFDGYQVAYNNFNKNVEIYEKGLDDLTESLDAFLKIVEERNARIANEKNLEILDGRK